MWLSLQYLIVRLLTHGVMLRLTRKSNQTYFLLLARTFLLSSKVSSGSSSMLSCLLTHENSHYSMFQMGWTDPSATDAANALAIELRTMLVSTSGYPTRR
jgi:hypothetical protein